MVARAADASLAQAAGGVRHCLSRPDKPIRHELFAPQILPDLEQEPVGVDRVTGRGSEGLASSVQLRKEPIERFHEPFTEILCVQ